MKLFISFSLFFFSPRYLAQANVVLLRRSEEELTEAGQEVARSGAEAALLRAEVQRLQEEKEEKTKSRERLGRQMSRELEELRAEHRVAG